MKYEKSKGYTLLVIPTEFQSGLFPGDVEKVISIEEIKEIMFSAIERNKVRIKENIEELKREVKTMNSIEKILIKCGKYF